MRHLYPDNQAKLPTMESSLSASINLSIVNIDIQELILGRIKS
ncbi:hypothetical protein VCRA2119O147_240047 [Vibrio crassostreae]|uniref:Uncharacterized protein n=2 Tax=Vibrio TaxID=662 RepID=A0A822N168_9VIBR|nr:hypothetical protein VCRA2116O28_100113 [Vibrio crassostreae]CDT71669.1 hypothetical protein VCR31J2_1290071 [Vibrio coralliirubri]CAK1703206.1 hypothetical protein VCRA2116O27_100113 [Vibrio crassostreae]CAK1721339.1 hypothetical protein VCRA2117O38_110111 [Vibrio crassostreae]CAK1721368.1 hypothetical protein VCRA2116O26_110110 [Vibrio crassostreae]